jgi:hypothetical protein
MANMQYLYKDLTPKVMGNEYPTKLYIITDPKEYCDLLGDSRCVFNYRKNFGNKSVATQTDNQGVGSKNGGS